MVALLDLNSGYVHWGPGEESMSVRDTGWSSAIVLPTWKEFAFPQDDLNEVVHFYFSVERTSVTCKSCDSTGSNPDTKALSEDFYDFKERGRRWCDRITQDEVDALIARGRLGSVYNRDSKTWGPPNPIPTVEEVNAANGSGGRSFDYRHDAINRWILIETRAKRLGVWGDCSECEGHGYLFTAPAAHVELTLWVLHPRKGCSRGVRIENIERNELPAIYTYLRAAAERNAQRFAKIVSL